MPNRRANRIRELREAENLSMDQLGARCVPKATGSQINKIEKGLTQLTQDWIYRISNALGVHPLEIIEPLPPIMKLLEGLAEADRQAVFEVANTMVRHLPKAEKKG